MKKRKFRLPGFQDLNREQYEALQLPDEGKHLVIGGPGSGKSIIALLRAKKLHASNKKYIFLCYNKVLSKANQDMIDIELKSKTILKWFYEEYEKLTGSKTTPKLKKILPDYTTITKELSKLTISDITTNLIIDEGQDMPLSFYDTLTNMGYVNIFVVADQNQQITETCSNIEQLKESLEVEENDVIVLKRNYRNSPQIARLSNIFYTDKATPFPKSTQNKEGTFLNPILFTYSNFHDCIDVILREADKDVRSLIGVFMSNNIHREKCFNSLKEHDIKLDNPRAKINSYSSGDDTAKLKFDEGGIIVLNDMSTKGLEFDVIYIVLDKITFSKEKEEIIKKKLYVMSTRASKKLIFFKYKGYQGNIEDILPQDEKILTRMELKHEKR